MAAYIYVCGAAAALAKALAYMSRIMAVASLLWRRHQATSRSSSACKAGIRAELTPTL